MNSTISPNDNHHTGYSGSRKDVLGLASGSLNNSSVPGSWADITNNLEQLERLGFEVVLAEPLHWILRCNGELPEYHLYSTDELATFAQHKVAESAGLGTKAAHHGQTITTEEQA